MSQRIDESCLQRLVDGALSEGERREFLVGVDQRPELWREVALAFVEEQIWRHEIAAALRCGDADECKSRPVRRAAASKRTWSMVSALAIGLLAMLAVGFQLGRWQSRSHQVAAPMVEHAGSGESENDAHAVTPDPKSPESPLQDPDDQSPEYRIMLPQVEGQIVDLPIYDESQIDTASWEGERPVIVEVLNERLSRRGYRADWQTRFLTGRLDDGRQVVVPWRTVSLRYDAQ
jgi:hypothetical protein